MPRQAVYPYGRSREMPRIVGLLEVVIKPRADGRVKVVGTLRCPRYVRVCQAKLGSESEAKHYACDMKARMEAGLDPLAGMDVIETYTLGTKGERQHHAAGSPCYRQPTAQEKRDDAPPAALVG